LAIFGKKDNAPAPAGSSISNVPIEQVLTLRKQGVSNAQIVEMLQRDGYKTYQIFDAMNQADLKGSSPSKVPEPPEQAQISLNQQKQPAAGMQDNQAMNLPPPHPDGFNPDAFEQQANQQYSQLPPSPPQQEFSQPGSASTDEIQRIEEISEAIIEEKWNEFIINVNKIIAWKERNEARMTAIEKRFDDLKKTVEELQKAIVMRIGEYDRHVTDVGTELKAMEKVFQKILPSFTANINELSRITADMKEPRRKSD
jgi:hypothetical protein